MYHPIINDVDTLWIQISLCWVLWLWVARSRLYLCKLTLYLSVSFLRVMSLPVGSGAETLLKFFAKASNSRTESNSHLVQPVKGWIENKFSWMETKMKKAEKYKSECVSPSVRPSVRPSVMYVLKSGRGRSYFWQTSRSNRSKSGANCWKITTIAR